MIKLVGTANPIADSKFVEEYVMNNKANQIFYVYVAHLIKIHNKDMHESLLYSHISNM